MRFKATFIGLAAVLTLAACEGSDFERGVLGAGGGALAAKALGEDPVTGAVIGGTAGVVCDDLTPGVCR